MKQITYVGRDEHGGRSYRHCVVFDGKAFSQEEAIEKNIASYEKTEKKLTYKVSTIGTFVGMVSPRSGWTNSVGDCIEYILYKFRDGINSKNGVTKQEAEIAFAFLYPDEYRKLRSNL